MSTSAVALTAHAHAPHLAATLASVEEQSVPTDARVAVVDRPSDETVQLLRAYGFTVHFSTSTAVGTRTRIAHNFLQALRATPEVDVVILGDHDDVWHPTRVEQHLSVMQDTRWMMTAADGNLIDESGNRRKGTLRSIFPVPAEWNISGASRNFAYALRHSVATGGASAIRRDSFIDRRLPEGWLHDRWWSLVATKHSAMHIDDRIVIDYRVAKGQQVGLETNSQDSSAAWLVSKIAKAPRNARRALSILGE